ncbi:aminoacyl-tRNA hydrolase [Thermodesulfovibrio hydrogeniphilus]
MVLIVGLGNPGRKYRNTRHNVGFRVIDELAEKFDFSFREHDDYLIAEGKIKDKDVILLKPLTYMNLSGRAVNKVANDKILKNLPNSLIVIHDDLDLPVGKIKIKKSGSSGGHKGVQSIINSIGNHNFIRIRIGIDKPSDGDISDYVLSPFSKEEKPLIEEKVLQATDAIVTILDEGVEKAMNIYNRGKA